MADFIVTTNGIWIPGYAFIYICRSVKGIVKFQLRQEEKSRVRVLLATDGEFPADGSQQVIAAVKKRLNSDDDVCVELVGDIQPAPSGKYRPVIGKLAEQLRGANQQPSGTPI